MVLINYSNLKITTICLRTVIKLVYSYEKQIIFRSIWPIHGTLIASTTLGQSGPGSNGNEIGKCTVPINPILIIGIYACFWNKFRESNWCYTQHIVLT